MKIFKVDRLEVRVAEDRAVMGLAAAEAVCGAIGEVLARKEAARGSVARASRSARMAS